MITKSSLITTHGARKYTNRILELDEDGMLDRDWLIRSLLIWMSEKEVKEFYDRIIEPEILDPLSVDD